MARQHAARVRTDLDEVRRRAEDMVVRARATRTGQEPGRSPAAEPGGPVRGGPVRGGPVRGGSTELRAAAQDLVDVHDRDEVVARVLAGTRRVVPGTRWSGLVLGDGMGRLSLRVGDDVLVEELEALQRRVGTGPAADVLAGGDDVVVPDLGAEARWPRFAAAAAARGVGGVLAVSVPSTRVPGVLVCYAEEAAVFDTGSLRAAATYADLAGIAFGSARRVAGLTRAVETRDVIGQAKGMLARRDGIDPEAAFRKLAAASQHANLKVADVARWVVEEQRLGARAVSTGQARGGDRADEGPPDAVSRARRTAEDLEARLASIEESVAETEESLADTYEDSARLRPHAAERLEDSARHARSFAAQEREQSRRRAAPDDEGIPPD